MHANGGVRRRIMNIRDLLRELRRYPPETEVAVAYWTEDLLRETEDLTREEAVDAINRFMALDNPADDAMADCVEAARQREDEKC